MPSKNSFEIFKSKHEQFFRKFRPLDINSEKHYTDWKSEFTDGTLEDYIAYCLKEALLFCAKNASNELEGYEWKLELDTKYWELQIERGGKDANYMLWHIHMDKLFISQLTLPFEFDIAIDSKECCSKCSRYHLKKISFESILKGKHLPYKSCKREGYCSCTYVIIPKI